VCHGRSDIDRTESKSDAAGPLGIGRARFFYGIRETWVDEMSIRDEIDRPQDPQDRKTPRGSSQPTGADALCQALLTEGVRILFGHPGGAILPFYDALYDVPGLRHVLTRHEQSAAHAADGYARATGRTGVCVATSGPGATNLVTGLATAMMDSVPLIALTGQVSRDVIGTEAFQETDIVSVCTAVTKRAVQVQDSADLARVVAEAFRLARTGRPGPVLIDVPRDIQVGPAAADLPLVPGRVVHGSGTANALTPSLVARLDAVAELLERSERPVVMVGRGVLLAGAWDLVREMADRADLPVTTTLLGLDAFPADHPLALGMPGMHGTERANKGIQEADLILGLGLRFDDRVIGRPDRFAPRAQIVHFDIDEAAVGRTIRPDLAVVGDLRLTLPELVRRTAVAEHGDWRGVLEQWSRRVAPDAEPSFASGPLGARHALRRVARRIGETEAIVVTDVGQHQMWLAQELPAVAPHTHLTSGGLGTMGYALPAAIGAALGRPERPVWVVAGDGGFQMTLQELATVVQEGLPLRIAVVNNGYLGMVRQWQEIFYEGRYSATELIGPDLVKLAEAYGIPAYRVDRAENLERVLDEMVGADGPALVDLRVVREENVYPMVPSGASLHELVMGPAVAASS
jgi:acetolactate synthase-1/2/3 large subunit